MLSIPAVKHNELSALFSHPLPLDQNALLLHAPRERYSLARIPLPAFNSADEVLVRVEAIGLNPVDWKSADYNFALPVLPALNGRDLAGTVVRVGSLVTRLKPGDRVFGPSTQYRDYRTSAFQSYAIASESSLGVIPKDSSVEECAAIGVGAVAAALALGSALGIRVGDFSPRDLFVGAEGEEMYHSTEPQAAGTPSSALERSSPEKEFLLVWGGGTVSGFFAAQLGKHAGLEVIVVASQSHAQRFEELGIDHFVDRSDPARAVEAILEISKGNIRLAIDCVGKATAAHAMSTLNKSGGSCLVGLADVPPPTEGVITRAVPIKTFHTNPACGRALMSLLEGLLARKELSLPPVEVIDGELEEAVNAGLDRLRAGTAGFGRLVVRVRQ